MAQENNCPQCGAQMPPDAPEGLCPKCLMRAIQRDNTNVTLDGAAVIEGPGTKIGRYELLSLIGEGGMGLVYLAEQKEPVKRRVALKIIKPGMDSRQVIARFEAERQALALLDHPNIAHVFDAGTTETGRPYFVMEYVKGMSITRYCDERRLDVEQRLRLFREVCEGVHHAHQKGIIHRDIKPSNILVSMHCDRAVPKIIDFGIAKAAASSLTEKTMFTFQGQLLGTPEYMSPEQVDLATQDIDTRSDIYSLGVVLYELLAGVLPFERESLEKIGFSELQRTLREQEPASPSIRLSNLGEKAKAIADSRMTQVVPLARRLHRELEWIPLKAMRKDRCRRYKSASDMADDIKNYLNGNPLIAGPETATYRIQKFVRKHAGSVATVVLVVAAIVLGLIVSTAMYLRAEDARQKEAVARAQAELSSKKEAVSRNEAEQAKNAEQEQRILAEHRAEDLRRTLYVNSIQLADAKYKEGNISRVRELLASCPNDLRSWEWERLNYILDQSAISIAESRDALTMALSPDGKHIVSGGMHKTIKVWDVDDGSELMTINRSNVNTTNLGVASLAFSPDGRQIVSGDFSGDFNIWDAATGKQLMTIKGHKNPIYFIAFSPDGRRMASRSYEIKLWDTANWTELMIIGDPETDKPDSTGIESCVTFNQNGKRIASAGGWDGQIKVWDTVTGQQIWSTKGHDFWAKSVSFSPDGRFIASGGDNHVRIWDAGTGSNVMTLRGHSAPVCSVSFNSDGKYIASGGEDNTIKIWDAASGETIMTLKGHEECVADVAFTPDGKRLVSCSWDGIKIWDIAVSRELARLIGHNCQVESVAFSPDGKQIVSADCDGGIKLWDISNGTEQKTILNHTGGLRARHVAFSPDGERIVSGDSSGTFRIWDTATGEELTTFHGPKGWSSENAVEFSPDGKLVASCSGGMDMTVNVWDATTGKELITLKGHELWVSCVAFSPNGKFIASGGCDSIKIWESTTGRDIRTLRGHYGNITFVAFSSDGKKIISSCCEDQTVKLWDAITGVELMTFKHGDLVLSATLSPDGKRVVSGCANGEAIIWDVATGVELLTLRAKSGFLDIAFSPDGKIIAGGMLDHTISLWESEQPTEGYERRKIGEIATRLVNELYEENDFYHVVLKQLRDDATIDVDVRRVAIQIANSRKWEDAFKLKNEAWETVSLPDKDVASYQIALEKVSKANALEPNDPAILRTLAVAQYRTAVYEEALSTLKKGEKFRVDKTDEPDLAAFALRTMILHQLGRTDEAKSTLDQLHALVKDEDFDDEVSFDQIALALAAMNLYKQGQIDESKSTLEQLDALQRSKRFANDKESKVLLAEAEKLIAGEK